MTSTVPDQATPIYPWGTSLAMAGAMVAGLSAGRSGRLALAAGITAVAGLSWLLRRGTATRTRTVEPPADLTGRVLGKTRAAEPIDCCSGAEKGPEGEACEIDDVAVGAPPQDRCVLDEAMPLIWEQGSNEPVSFGAIGSQTVWYGAQEALEVIPPVFSPEPLAPGAVPAVPALASVGELPESFFRAAPPISLESLPTVPAIVEGSEVLEVSASEILGAPKRRELPLFVPQLFSDGTSVPEEGGIGGEQFVLEKLRGGPHRSVVPHAPVGGRLGGNRVMLAAAVALVILALTMILGAFQQDGWVSGLKLRWQAARGEVLEHQVSEAGSWTVPLSPQQK